MRRRLSYEQEDYLIEEAREKCRTKKTIRIGDKCISKKRIKSLIQLHGRIGATLAISDIYGVDERDVKKAIKKMKVK